MMGCKNIPLLFMYERIEYMAREIKFRVWIPSVNKIVYNPYIDFDQRDQIADIFNGKRNRFIWMQYTGLKDKNGKEIYEGDVLNDPGGFPTPCDTVITFQEGSFVAILNNYLIRPGAWKSMEVIGNVYENKELLE